jgi:hypothetical protein
MLPTIDSYGLGIDNSSAVTVKDNAVVGTDDDISGFGWSAFSDAPQLTENSLTIAGASRTAEVKPLDDP